jgi:hypothetical protein
MPYTLLSMAEKLLGVPPSGSPPSPQHTISTLHTPLAPLATLPAPPGGPVLLAAVLTSSPAAYLCDGCVPHTLCTMLLQQPPCDLHTTHHGDKDRTGTSAGNTQHQVVRTAQHSRAYGGLMHLVHHAAAEAPGRLWSDVRSAACLTPLTDGLRMC